MRRLFGCFFTLTLLGAIFLLLLTQGPGLRSLPARLNPPPLVNAVARHLGISERLTAWFPPPAPTPSAAPPTTAVPPTPTEIPLSPTVTPEPGNMDLTVSVHGLVGEPLDAVIDGNAITLTAHVTNSTQATIADTVRFSLGTMKDRTEPIGSCHIDIEPGQQTWCMVPVVADGWAWQDHQRVTQRTVFATLTEQELTATVEVPIRPKPVVLVHGFASYAATWSAWTSIDGFLAQWGIAGYAVGDGQFNIEPMDTGDFTKPLRPTKSIAENAAIVSRYVEAVREATGAQRIDLVAHSMGGLISRYYVSRLMPLVERQGLPTVPAVNQLYMIGTPNGGTSCAIPGAALGMYPPAMMQLTPTYVRYMFNVDTRDTRGVPLFVLAGDPIRSFTALVCTSLPTDVFVSTESAAGAIPVMAQMMPVRHNEQTMSPEVFATVLQSLSRGPQDYPIPMPTAPAVATADSRELQVALVDSGTLSGGRMATLNVTVDEAEQASFLLYAPGQAAEMSMFSSLGRTITSETAQSAPDISMATMDGHAMAATQGFTIQKPEAGEWHLVLRPGADAKTDEVLYTVALFVQSELRLTVDTPSPVVPANKPVPIRATLSGPVEVKTVEAVATVRNMYGQVVGEVTLFDDGAHDDGQAGDGVLGGAWVPMAADLYTVVVTASGQNGAGNAFQRLGMLAVDVQ